jgi:hypothetical protein
MNDVAWALQTARGVGPVHPPHAHAHPIHKLHTGPLHSTVAGRTDHLPSQVPNGSFVIPADVVSGFGEGNSMAGFKVLKRMFQNAHRQYGGTPYGGNSGPYGSGSAPYGGMARGGATDSVPVAVAGGEHVLAPHEVAFAGMGDMEKGHRVLDEFVIQSRKKLIDTLKKLPGPKRD